MPSLHSKWTACLLAVTFVFGIAGNSSAATNPMTLNDLSQMVLGLKEEVDRLSKANKTLSKKLEQIETQRYAARTPSSAYQIGTPERLMKARLSKPVRVASLGTTRVAEKKPTRETKASDLGNRITALEKQSHSEIRPYVRYDLAVGHAKQNAYGAGPANRNNQPDINGAVSPLSVGAGLRLNDSLRADLTLDYYSKNLTVPISNRVDYETELSNIFVLANVYYDFSSIDRFTPYVGAGLGFSYFWTDNMSRTSNGHGAETFAASASAGVNVQLSHGLSADIGYRYANLGFYNFDNELTNDLVDGGYPDLVRFQRHDFRMGLRYAF